MSRGRGTSLWLRAPSPPGFASPTRTPGPGFPRSPPFTLTLGVSEFESLVGPTVPAAPEVAGTVPSAPAIGRSRFEASRERVVAGYRPVRHGDLPASSNTELLAEDVRVRLRRSGGDAKPLADFVIRAPGGD